MTYERTAETSGIYQANSEVDSYARSSSVGLVGMIEHGFVRKIIRRYGKRKALKILDVGTGPGWIPTWLSTMRPEWQISALDASELMLNKARKNAASRNAKIEWLQASADATRLPADHFDLVISHFALHEFPDPKAVLLEMIRVVKETGEILIQDLARPHPVLFSFMRLGMLLGHPLSPDMRRQGRASLMAAYKAREIQKILEECGVAYRVRTNRPLSLLRIFIQKSGASSNKV